MKGAVTRKMLRRRGQRAKGKPVVLTDRDLDFLTLIGLCRYVSTTQLAAEFFPSVDRCRRRMRALYDAGYVSITISASTEPNLVSLKSAAVTALGHLRPAVASRVRRSGPINHAGMRHHLAVVDTRLYVAALCEKRGTPLVAWSDAGGALSRELGLPGHKLRPDALFEVEDGDDVHRVAVEVDCGTESSAVLLRKLQRYRDVFDLPELDELWVVAVGGARRERHLARLASQAGVGRRCRVLNHDLVLMRPVEAPPALLSADGR